MSAANDSPEPSVLVAAFGAMAASERAGLVVTRAAFQGTSGSQGLHLSITDPVTERWIVVLDREDDYVAAATAVQAGASAVITTASSTSDFRSAIAALGGGPSPYFSGSISHALARTALRSSRSEQSEAERPAQRLTPRELEIVALLAQGCTNQEIAETLVVSINTVRTHLHSLARKLDATNRARIVANALSTGLVDRDILKSQGPNRDHNAGLTTNRGTMSA